MPMFDRFDPAPVRQAERRWRGMAARGPSRRCARADLMILCARIGFNP